MTSNGYLQMQIVSVYKKCMVSHRILAKTKNLQKQKCKKKMQEARGATSLRPPKKCTARSWSKCRILQIFTRGQGGGVLIGRGWDPHVLHININMYM
jgi:hypothetical protein